MVKPGCAFAISTKADIFAHSTDNTVHNCSYRQQTELEPETTTLLLDILKTLEVRLQTRGFLSSSQTTGDLQPLWFIAENCRNTYLWRNGYSLEDLQRFEFWVDIQKLAGKRIQQLELLRDGYSLSSVPWGMEIPDQTSLLQEIDYIKTFLLVTRKIRKHITALSQAGLLLASEIEQELRPRQVVVLP